MTTYSKWWTALAGGALLATAACERTRDTGAVTSRTPDSISTTMPAADAARHEVAMVRVINASPADKMVSVWAGDSLAFGEVAYNSVSQWHTIPDDRFNFQIKAAPGMGDPLAENRENLRGGGHYTIVALPDQGGPDKRNLRVLDDDLKPVPADKVRIRFINGVASDTDVDLILTGRESPLFDGINFKHEAGWDEIAPTAGTLIVRPDNDKTTLAKLANVKLESGKSYTFVYTGRNGKYELLKIVDDVAPAPQD